MLISTWHYYYYCLIITGKNIIDGHLVCVTLLLFLQPNMSGKVDNNSKMFFSSKKKRNVEKGMLKGIKGEEKNVKIIFDEENDEVQESFKKIKRDPELKESFQSLEVNKEKLKMEEIISLEFDYWVGIGYRKKVDGFKKSTTIKQFLQIAKEKCSDLTNVPVDNLFFVKDDFIIPHRFSFLDLQEFSETYKISFDFGQVKPNSIGKVVERGWYDKNRHIFPASKWTVLNVDSKNTLLLF